MYCIDTNIAIDVFRGDLVLGDKVQKAINEGKEMFISAISVCELFKGSYIIKAEKKRSEDIYKIKEFVKNINFVSFDENCCEEFGKIYGLLSSSGRMIPEPDIMIAAIAKINNLILITRDKKHFAGTGVRLEAWRNGKYIV